MALQLHSFFDLWQQQTDYVGSCRDSIARPEFFGHSTAADEISPFQYEHLSARTSHLESTHQAVVAAADDNEVVSGIVHDLSSLPVLIDESRSALASPGDSLGDAAWPRYAYRLNSIRFSPFGPAAKDSVTHESMSASSSACCFARRIDGEVGVYAGCSQ